MRNENRSFEPSPQRLTFDRIRDLQSISAALPNLPDSKLKQRLMEMVNLELNDESVTSILSEVNTLRIQIQERDTSIRQLQDQIKGLSYRGPQQDTPSSLPREGYPAWVWFIGGAIITYVILRFYV